MDEVLKIKDLHVTFDVRFGRVQAVRGISLSIQKGEILALVGESGCGKSVTARSILRLDEAPTTHTKASVLSLAGRDILSASDRELLEIRRSLTGMVFQDPLSYLNPTMTIGRQVTETLLRSGRKTAAECRLEAVRLLELVQIPLASIRAQQYPHQLSGGMRQRAMLAMALAGDPALLIADEPTTALDPTIQLQVLSLMKKMQLELQTAVLLITHDLSVVAHTADRAAVMYAGKIVETGGVDELFQNPAHPYTKGLLDSLPTAGRSRTLHSIAGTPPDLSAPPNGCAFAARCASCMKICLQQQPPVFVPEIGHTAACWLLHPNCPKGENI